MLCHCIAAHSSLSALKDVISVSQVYWNSLSRTYWVHWHMIEILGNGSSGQAEKETQEKASSLTETLKLTACKSLRFSFPLLFCS